MAFDAPHVIEMQAAGWSPDLEADLRMIAMHDEDDIAAFREQVMCGAMDVIALQSDGARIGSVVWSVTQEYAGPVLVINALAAKPVPGVCVVTDIHNRMADLARVSGCRAMRCWTKRAGLVRKLESKTWTRAAYVLEHEV